MSKLKWPKKKTVMVDDKHYVCRDFASSVIDQIERPTPTLGECLVESMKEVLIGKLQDDLRDVNTLFVNRSLELLRAEAERDRYREALVKVLEQPFHGEWDAQACYVQNVLARK